MQTPYLDFFEIGADGFKFSGTREFPGAAKQFRRKKRRNPRQIFFDPQMMAASDGIHFEILTREVPDFVKPPGPDLRNHGNSSLGQDRLQRVIKES